MAACQLRLLPFPRLVEEHHRLVHMVEVEGEIMDLVDAGTSGTAGEEEAEDLMKDG
jgi:hypothetical protein